MPLPPFYISNLILGGQIVIVLKKGKTTGYGYDAIAQETHVTLHLECEVAKSSREREVTVDTIELHEATGVLNALALPLVARLVVRSEAERPPAHRGHRPTVTRV